MLKYLKKNYIEIEHIENLLKKIFIIDNNKFEGNHISNDIILY